MNSTAIKLIECPRDAMQGISHFIPTDLKAAYLNLLLEVGFDTLDFGSFVSAKAIPQMRDTSEVLSQLDVSRTNTKLLAIVANLRGVQEAVQHDKVSYIGFPFSISETFQMRNTNSTIQESLLTVEQMVSLCRSNGKKAVVYLSMGFGNPYGDDWSEDIVLKRAEELIERGVEILSLADTTGMSSPENIKSLLPMLRDRFPQIEIGVHLHSRVESRDEKIQAAFDSGCTRFDSALRGYGGCPMAADDLTGNIATENVIAELMVRGISTGLNMDKWQEAMAFSLKIFG